jgi:hypothetical protein
MLKLELTETYGWEAAIRGMRNPLNSWEKSDSKWDGFGEADGFSLGDNDLALMRKLAKAGDDHGKFARMLTVTVDITAPLYWWKEFDTYRIGVEKNSCSTMHKIHAKEFALDDFSHEHLFDGIDRVENPDNDMEYYENPTRCLDYLIRMLNYYRLKYLETKDKRLWWQLIQLLPTSYNQKRTVQLNYQVLKNIYFARRYHKLDEWHTFCDWILTLPYFKQIFDIDERTPNDDVKS